MQNLEKLRKRSNYLHVAILLTFLKSVGNLRLYPGLSLWALVLCV